MRAWPALLLVMFAVCAARPASAQLEADLSSHLISITSNFTGTELLLFGATDGPGDIVVVVQGPRETLTVRRKQRIAGIWLNGRAISFADVPAYYAVASTRPLEELAPTTMRAQHRMGGEFLAFSVAAGTQNIAGAELAAFREALVRNKRNASLYFEAEGSVTFVGERLFRTNIVIPSTAPDGTYNVNIYLIRNQRVIDQKTTPLSINKAGLERTVHELAHEQPAAYGVIAIAIAIVAGWGAGAVFRRRT